MSIRCKRVFIKSSHKEFVDISFDIDNSFALIGQSGSGKSLTLKALLGMLPSDFDSELKIESDYELIRGKYVTMVPQNPFTALSPLTKIKNQFFVSKDVMSEYISLVELDDTVLDKFTSELSGGQLQRVVLAMALVLKPKLLLLDEPTTALDTKTKGLILKLLKNLQKRDNFDMLFVTHDIYSVENLCESIAILKDGKIVEQGRMYEVLRNPQKEYTKELLRAGFAKREFRL